MEQSGAKKHPVLDKDGKDLGKKIKRLDHVNPRVVDQELRQALEAARNLLTFERHLDSLENEKGARGALPDHVEERAAHGAAQAHEDARKLARAAVRALNEFESTGAFAETVPAVAGELGTKVNASELLGRAKSPPFTDFLRERGMPPEVLGWGIDCIDVSAISLSSRKDTLVAEGGGRSSAVAAKNATPVRIVHPAEFVDGGLYRRVKSAPGTDGAISPYAGALALLADLLRETEQRAHRTTEDGVQVLPTGIHPLLVASVIATVIWLGAGTVLLFCRWGWITNRNVCYVAAFVFAVGIVVVTCLWLILAGVLDEGCMRHFEWN